MVYRISNIEYRISIIVTEYRIVPVVVRTYGYFSPWPLLNVIMFKSKSFPKMYCLAASIRHNLFVVVVRSEKCKTISEFLLHFGRSCISADS